MNDATFNATTRRFWRPSGTVNYLGIVKRMFVDRVRGLFPGIMWIIMGVGEGGLPVEKRIQRYDKNNLILLFIYLLFASFFPKSTTKNEFDIHLYAGGGVGNLFD